MLLCSSSSVLGAIKTRATLKFPRGGKSRREREAKVDEIETRGGTNEAASTGEMRVCAASWDYESSLLLHLNVRKIATTRDMSETNNCNYKALAFL